MCLLKPILPKYALDIKKQHEHSFGEFFFFFFSFLMTGFSSALTVIMSLNDFFKRVDIKFLKFVSTNFLVAFFLLCCLFYSREKYSRDHCGTNFFHVEILTLNFLYSVFVNFHSYHSNTHSLLELHSEYCLDVLQFLKWNVVLTDSSSIF